MTTEDNKRIVRAYLEEALGRGDLAAVDRYVDELALSHAPLVGEGPGREGHRHLVRTLRGAFPDLRVKVEDVVAEGDRVVARWTGAATHQGELAGVPATGRPVRLSAITEHRLRDGRIAEAWAQWDTLDMFHQMGAAPRARNAPGTRASQPPDEAWFRGPKE